MTARLPYWRVDAFVTGPGSGNPAAVIECERWLDDSQMQAIARESGGEATAFLVKDESGVADWQIRWFGLASEIRLCGHATLASGHVLLGRSSAGSVAFRSRHAGIVEARRTDSGVEVGLPAIPTVKSEWAAAARLVGARPSECWRSDEGYAALFFDDEEQVRALAPDLAAIGALGDVQIACTARGRNADIVSRVFTRAGGEDSVTGSAHAVLAPLWSAKLGRQELDAVQASPRGGRLSVALEGERVWVGGACTTLIEGSFYLSG